MVKTFDDILSHLRFGKSFSMSRWGDGEWSCLLGHMGRNCDNHSYDKTLGGRLKQIVLHNPPYALAIQPKAINEVLSWEIRSFLQEHEVNREWPNADIIHNASIGGRLDELREVLIDKRVTIVGRPHLAGWLGGKDKEYIVTPPRNCWLNYAGTLNDCVKSVENGSRIFLFACGMMANVLIDDLYRIYDGITLLDVGSVLEPYVGNCNRRYHQKILERENK